MISMGLKVYGPVSTFKGSPKTKSLTPFVLWTDNFRGLSRCLPGLESGLQERPRRLKVKGQNKGPEYMNLCVHVVILWF